MKKNNKKLEVFSKRLAQKAFKEEFFISCAFELTYRCNLQCVHCLNRGIEIEELGYKQICEIIDKLIKQGCLYFLFTGGEPFVREDFLDIYLYTKKKGGIITIYTNATLIDKAALKIFEKYPPRKIEISIYGIQASTHESVTQIPGSFEAMMRTIYVFKTMGINFSIKTMLITTNKDEFWEIKKFAEKLDVGFRYDPVILPRKDGDSSNLVYRLSPEEFFFDFEIKDKQRLDQYVKKWKRLNKFRRPKEKIYVCSGGKWSCSIDPQGKIKTCIFSDMGYDLKKKGNIKEARDFFSQILNRGWNIDSKCKDCNIPPLCGNCPGKAEFVVNNPQGYVEYLCRLGHLRAKFLEII